MDTIDAKRRSRNMARIKAKNTKPELILRKYLSANGYKYRIHFNLKGKPDIVFLKKKVAIFVNGCFWHGHGCKVDHTAKSNLDFWNAKISKNKERDILNNKALTSEGWNVFIIWECDIRKNSPETYKDLFNILNDSSTSASTTS
ncbi:MAG: Patch repair protein [Candidatus Woesebacteria bacterium GW2011_GWB1_38_8]|uniref:Very short patch repair endonuclease n=1 Tax=Candidatus Woesebacteria bacterium GW2011_GWB1_38_8 TaxID=1618570 RepID=A0A0G0LBG7_9BACT|nr:MAG: Patch repair protein [Candidatus Woesebacteria bacterium GW2011_GWB1_38_8]KKS77780.1 MAG: Patch repair protein [Candidatus Woesebacteria bacterium GW2011_GWC1_42_9]